MTVREFLEQNPGIEILNNMVGEGVNGDGWIPIEDALDEEVHIWHHDKANNYAEIYII